MKLCQSASGIHAGQCVVLVDLENLEMEAQEKLAVLDWELFRKECLRLGGPIKVGFVFIPAYYNQIAVVRQICEQGFYPILCWKARREPGVKDKDKADYMINNLARELFGNNPDVAHVFIASNDGDFAPLVTFFRNRGRQVTVFGLGNISQALKEVVDPENPVRKFPTTPV